MPLPWKKSKSGRISRFVSDLQQSPKHGGSLVVETGFPTSLIDLFVKNRDRLKQSSSKSSGNDKAQTLIASNHYHPPPRRRVSSPSPSPPLQSRRSFPQKLDSATVTEDPSVISEIEESFVLSANRHDGEDGGGNHGGGMCVLIVTVFKIFLVAVLALSTKKLAVGITLSAFGLLFLELAVARVFRLLNLRHGAQVRLDSFIGKLIGKKRRQEKLEESSPTREIVEESSVEIRVPQPEMESPSSEFEKAKPLPEEKKVLTIRDVVFKSEKSKSSKLKSKIVKKIVPKKLRSYKKKKKMKKNKEKEEETVEIVEEEEESVTEVSSLFSEERIESETSERDDISSNPPSLKSCGEIEEEEEEGDGSKAMILIVIVLAGLLSGKVLAIVLTFSSCLILRVVCCRSNLKLVSETF